MKPPRVLTVKAPRAMTKDRSLQLAEIVNVINDILYQRQVTIEESVSILGTVLALAHYEIQDDKLFFKELQQAIRYASAEVAVNRPN